MATSEAVAALRLLIAEPTQDTYDDETLSARLDSATNEYVLAYDIWTEKAAAAAGLVDMSEGGSTRKLGDLHEQALAMAEQMRERAVSSTNPPNGAGVRIKKLSRP